MHEPERQFTPFERCLRRLYEITLSTLPRPIRRRWANDMRATFGQRLRDATDAGGIPATALVGSRELGSIALAAMQSRFSGQATGRVHRAHDAQDGSDVWRTDPVPALIFLHEDRRPLKLATVGALACHLVLFLVVFPESGTPADIVETPPEVVELKRLPPPPEREIEPPDARVRKAPVYIIPDPTPLDPEPIFVEHDIADALDDAQPVLTDFVVGLPMAPPTPLNERLRAGVDVERPRLIERVQPTYPELAVRARLECTVVLESLIGKTGDVLDIKLLRGCGLGLDEAALDAVYQWRYTPTLINGRPVEVIANVTVRFELR